MFNNFKKKYHAVYEKMRKNSLQSDITLRTIYLMRSGYWIPKAKNALSGYVILIAFPPQQWLDECAQRGGGVIRPLCVWLTWAPKEQSGQICVTATLPTRQELMETVKGSKSPEADLEDFEKTNISHSCRSRPTIPW